MRVEVQNIVIQGEIPGDVYLNVLAKVGAKYEPQKFPGAILKLG